MKLYFPSHSVPILYEAAIEKANKLAGLGREWFDSEWLAQMIGDINSYTYEGSEEQVEEILDLHRQIDLLNNLLKEKVKLLTGCK